MINNFIVGIGYIGIGKYNTVTNRKFYMLWYNMLLRCYDEKTQLNKPTYINCSVVPEWLNFQIFAEWCEQNYIDGFVLDKDILFKGNKIYGPDTCCFVPQEINKLFTKTNKLRGNLPIGISLKRKRYSVQVNRYGKHHYYGCFDTPEQAFHIYKYEKTRYIREVAKKWKDKISQKVFDSLINYKIEITD